MSRWIIFTLDLLICFVSMTAAYIIKYNFDFSNLNYTQFSQNVLIISAISTVVFLAVKTYSGIIRYTSAQDSFRILFAVLISNGAFFILNLFLVASSRQPIISNIILIINVSACFLLMVTYRVLVKYFFLYIKNLKLDKRRGII